MLLAFSVSPTTTDTPDGSVSEAVARAVRVVRDSGLPCETTSMFTTIEGEWDECMDVVKRACDAVAEVSPRVALVLKADIRPNWTTRMVAMGRVKSQGRYPPGLDRSDDREGRARRGPPARGRLSSVLG